MECGLLDLVGGSGERPTSPNDPVAPPARFGDQPFNEAELAELAAMPVVDLARLHLDMLEADDDMDSRSIRTRQIAREIRKRKLSKDEESAAYHEAQRGV